MPPKDPTDPIREMAAGFPEALKGTACTQSSFKTKRSAYLYIGPGTKGQGFKAMFKLERSKPQAAKLAAEQPDRFEVGNTSWVAARFTAEKPLPRTIWSKWLKESYELSCSATPPKAKATGRVAKKKLSKKS